MKWTVKLVTKVVPGESIEQEVATFVFQTNGLAHHKGDSRGLHLPHNLCRLRPAVCNISPTTGGWKLWNIRRQVNANRHSRFSLGLTVLYGKSLAFRNPA